MLALVGVPLLGVPRGPTLGEHGHALAVDDAPFLTDRSILRNLSQGVRECSAGRQGAAKECLAAVREAAHRWLYTQPEGPLNTAEADAAAVKQAAADVAKAKGEDVAAAHKGAAAEKALADAAAAATKEREEREEAAATAEEQAAAKAEEAAAAAEEQAVAEEQAAAKAEEQAAAEDQAAYKAEEQAAAGAAKIVAHAAAKDMKARPVSIRHPWRALRANWWMPFIDGWAHQCGARAFDQSKTLTRLDGDGDFSGALRSQHAKFSDYELMHGTLLNIDMVEQMNMQLQGLSWAANPDFGAWEAVSPYTEWQPRKAVGARSDVVGSDMMGYKGAVSFPDKEKIFSHAMAEQDSSKDRDLYHRIRAALIGRPLDEFDAAIAKDDCGISRWTSNARERLSLEQHHPRAALGCLLPAAATLYAKMAELHPFIDGNSRTRTMMLNIQLARAGAHPVVLYNNGWGVYHMNNLEDLMQYLLGGYCAWEYVVATGKSPYIGPTPSFDCATPPYENHTDMRYMGANRSPIRLYDRETDECIIPGAAAAQ